MNQLNQRRALLSLACLAVLMMLGVPWWTSRAMAREESAKPAGVRLVIDYGEGVEKHFNTIAWSDGMTVASAMALAKSLTPPRGLAFESRGEGERGMVLSIDGLANEGGGKGTRNWLFWVNGEPGDRSYAIAPLKAGDVATWRFTTYDALGKRP